MAKKPANPPKPDPLPPALVEEPVAAATPQEAEVVGLWARNVTPLLPSFPSRERIADIGFLLDVVLRLVFAGLFAYLAYWWLDRVGGIVDRQTEDKKLSDAVSFPKFGGHEVNGVDSDQGVRRCLASARRTRPSSSSRPSR